MKKIFCLISCAFIISQTVFAEIIPADDTFYIDLSKDYSNAVIEESVSDFSNKGSSSIAQGVWIETTGKTNSIIRDFATGEKKGYEFDNQHFLSNANWWFWGDIGNLFHLDAEIGLWKFDKTLYQEDSFALNVPEVSWGDGFQSLFSMLFSPFYNWNDNSVGAFNKFAFSISSPYINVKAGYGNLKENGMSEFSGIYNVLDRWLDVGKGFTEITNGKKLQSFGNVRINSLAGFSMMRGTYGMYDVIDTKIGENVQIAGTFSSITNAEQLFYYNTDCLNAASVYFAVNPADFLKLEAHGLTTFGSDINYSSKALAGALRISFNNENLFFSAKASIAGEDVNSVWGSDGKIYDDINADTITGKIDFKLKTNDFITIGLDEKLTFNDLENLPDSLYSFRTQPLFDFNFQSFTNLDFSASTYAVVTLDRLSKETCEQKILASKFEEAGIELEAKDIAPFVKKLTFDYAVKIDSAEWKNGNFYEPSVIYNSFMALWEKDDTVSFHAAALIRNKIENDATFVPFGFSLGAKINNVSFIPGKPMFWFHFCYGMNPYSENNYSLYRADNWMNKAPHRTYLLNSLYENYTESQIALGFIWDLK